MSDDTKKISAHQQAQLDTGDDTPKLQTSDDLALEALSQAQSGDNASSGTADDVKDQTEDEVEASDQLAETITALQNVIERNANNLDELKSKIKLQREQLRSVFENDTQLSEAQEQLTSYNSQVKSRKSQLQADPTVTRLKVEISELSQQKKEIEEALSNHLVNYYQLTNSTSFDTSEGDQREFTIKASVKSRKR